VFADDRLAGDTVREIGIALVQTVEPGIGDHLDTRAMPTLSLIHIAANGVERLTNPELELIVL
jgi:hypothetical protein